MSEDTPPGTPLDGKWVVNWDNEEPMKITEQTLRELLLEPSTIAELIKDEPPHMVQRRADIARLFEGVKPYDEAKVKASTIAFKASELGFYSVKRKRFYRCRFENLAGQRFGKLLVEGFSHIKRRKGKSWPFWKCRCDCGTIRLVNSESLKSGNTKSCGCTRSLSRKEYSIGSKRSAYFRWRKMHERCTKPKTNNYKYYGGRGITVCQEWNSFEAFFRDMGIPPKGTVLDRLDNAGHYCKSNCRWVDYKTSNRNRRSNALITHNGKTQCTIAWAEELGIPAHVIYERRKFGDKTPERLLRPSART